MDVEGKTVVSFGAAARIEFKELAVGDRARRHPAEGGLEQVLLLDAENVLLGGEARRRHRRASHPGEHDRAGRVHRELGDRVGNLKAVLARHADRHGDLRVRVQGVHDVGKAAAPAGGERLIGHAALPLDLLVRVREELRWERVRPRVVLGEGHGLDQGPRVRKQRQAALGEELLDLGHGRVQPPGPSVAVRLGRDRQEARLGQREDRAVRRVQVVVRSVRRNEEVVRVVASVQKEAHERLVVGRQGVRCQGADHPQLGEGGEHSGRAHGRAGPSDEPPACHVVERIHLWMAASGDVAAGR